jgi:hypothetical protein
MTTVPNMMEHEIRTEIMRRSPTVSLAIADRLAAQSNGNMRWAVLQGLGGSDGFVTSDICAPAAVNNWATLLGAMEKLQSSGSSPRAWLDDSSPIWERPGGACPWAITAKLLSKSC